MPRPTAAARRLKRRTVMDGFVGMLAVAGGFGLAYGMTALGLHMVLSVMPRKGAGQRATPTPKPAAN